MRGRLGEAIQLGFAGHGSSGHGREREDDDDGIGQKGNKTTSSNNEEEQDVTHEEERDDGQRSDTLQNPGAGNVAL